LSLVLVHVAAALHVWHWYVNGTTVTPVEPSEAMQTLGQGLVNAGFILFVLLILSTLIFGRFFCGWGCHIIALQDLCTWMLKKVGIRPRPLRSRLLVFVPLFAAVWMFVLPTLVRISMGLPGPEYRAHLTTDYFWDRFPGLAVAFLTFAVCGFVIVYLLGNKGFCTYACPYGGIFGLADQLAPGKIRVTDACEGCGHCTATCTSNVQVHEEVRVYGKVVDPGCMKCMDCTTVCPKDALYFGFGMPSFRSQPRALKRKVRYDLSWPEEIALAFFFLASVAILRALYDGVPFLLALGLASISAFVLLVAARLFYRKDLRMQTFRLRADGRVTASGFLYLGLTGLWVVFLGHSAWVQYLTIQGARIVTAGVAMQAAAGGRGSPDAARRLRRGIAMLERSERVGLVTPANLLGRIASGYSYLGQADQAEAYYRRAVERAPAYAEARYELARHARAREDHATAVEQLREVVARRPDHPGAFQDLADLLLQLGRAQEALELMEALRRDRPDNIEVRLAHGLILAQVGQTERGLEETQAVLALAPQHATGYFNLGQILARDGEFEESFTAFRQAVEFDPTSAEIRFMLAKVGARLGRWQTVREELEVLLEADPLNATYAVPWARAVAETGDLAQTIEYAEATAEFDRAARFRLTYLYAVAGRHDGAR
jgi:polyferredoxin/tetratricopeptide (TPR) repeat protein